MSDPVHDPRVIEAFARVMCDHAEKWGDRLFGWDDSGEDVRDTFREGASEALTAALSVVDDDGVPVLSALGSAHHEEPDA